MKYISMMNTPERGPYSIFNWPKKDFEAHIAYYRSAARRTTSIPERDYLTTQVARINAEASPTAKAQSRKGYLFP